MTGFSRSKIDAALTALRQGDYLSARSISTEILALNPHEPNALQALGVIAWQEGRMPEARTYFERANASAPNHPPILNSLGVIYHEIGELLASRSMLERAVGMQPDFAEAWHNLGTTLASLGLDAREAFNKAIAVQPGNSAALAKLAHYLEARHELEAARRFADQALSLDPKNYLAIVTLINLALRAGSNQDALSLIDRALSTAEITPTNRAILLSKRASALDRLSRFSESFEASAAANAMMREARGKSVEKAVGPRSPATLQRLEEFARAAPASMWRRSAADSAKSPVFLVGFPRSGTTMLDQILSTVDSVTVLEEKENIVDAWMEILMQPGGLEHWKAMGPEDAERLVAAYWRRALTHIRGEPRLIVDKLPLDTALLGIIHFLFPTAKIIFAVRDPRDVVLSCFQQMFGLNSAMLQFLDLTAAASYYDQVMRLGVIWREKLPLDVLEVRYERIVVNFDAEVGALLEFLDLPWSGGLRNFHQTALKRTIRTPSATQVVQPLYDSALGKWRNYEREIAPVRGLLDPWARRFGYET
jgi:tetratricopeptide (TPR) repeat protein